MYVCVCVCLFFAGNVALNYIYTIGTNIKNANKSSQGHHIVQVFIIEFV